MSTRYRVFLDIESRASSGRVFIELYNDLAPKASENFRRLCIGNQISNKTSPPDSNDKTELESKKKKQKEKIFSFKNVRFHRIVAPEFIVQAGEDLDGESIYHNIETDSYYFSGENNNMPVNERGLVCMANENGDPDKNTSQFFITLQNGLGIEGCTVFGRIVRGMEVLEALEGVLVDAEDRPVQGEEVVIKRSGELELKNKSKCEDKAQFTNNVTTTDDASINETKRSIKKGITTENSFEKNQKKPASENKITQDVTVEKPTETDATITLPNKSGYNDKKDNKSLESAHIENEAGLQKKSNPLIGDRKTSGQSRTEYFYHSQQSRADKDDLHKYNCDDRSRYSRNDRGFYDDQRYDKKRISSYSRNNRDDSRWRWDDRRPYTSHKDDDQKTKDQPKVIFKGRGSMKFKDREFGRL